jgi:hypothetical protein
VDGGLRPMEALEEPVKFFSSPLHEGRGLISASVCSPGGSVRQCFDEKQHPDFGKRSVLPWISDLMFCTCPEISLFSNDATRDLSRYNLAGVAGSGTIGVSGSVSTKAILTSVCPVRRHDRQCFDEKQHPDFRTTIISPWISDLMPFLPPEISTFSNDAMAGRFRKSPAVSENRSLGRCHDYPGIDTPVSSEYPKRRILHLRHIF